jgi:menaquinol-cytochrome c reductase cytochrome b subunit
MSAMGKIESRTGEAGRFVAGWVEDRTGAISWLVHFLNHPAPKRGAWLYALGTTALFLMTLQFLTGILLLFYYVPTTDHAWNSIHYIMTHFLLGSDVMGPATLSRFFALHVWVLSALIAPAPAVARRRPRAQARGVRQRDGVPRQDREAARTEAS